MTETVLMEIQNAVAWVTLNRPMQLNGLNFELSHDLYQVIQNVAKDDVVRCVVIRGAGEHFMAGGDIQYFNESMQDIQTANKDALKPLFEQVHGAIETIQQMGKPVIASVQGAAAGYGLSLMMACDLVIAADNAKFTTAYKHLGLSPDGGATYFLPRIVGAKKAAELVMLAERFDAAEALRLGLINKVVSLSELEAATTSWAQTLATGPREALMRSKDLLRLSSSHDLKQHLNAEEQAFTACAKSKDFSEGVLSFLEKRKANFY